MARTSWMLFWMAPTTFDPSEVESFFVRRTVDLNWPHVSILYWPMTPPFTLLDKIPTGRRVDELINEKSMSRQQVAERIGINRTTFDMMVKRTRGREIYGYELKKINSVLEISYERFMQSDMIESAKKFKEALKIRDYEAALSLAKEMNAVARGCSERCRTLNDVGRAYFYLEQYDKAHEYWLEAKFHAETILKKYGDSEKLYTVLRNLLISFDRRKEYSHALDIINQVEEVFRSNPERSGVIAHAYAMIAFNRGDMDKYREKMYESLDCFSQTDNKLLIGKATHNVACIEYQFGNYEKSKELFEQAFVLLQDEPEIILYTVKDFAKTLLDLNLNQQVISMIEDYLPIAESRKKADLQAKLLILLSTAKNNAEHAEKALSIVDASIATKLFACRYLLNYYVNANDVDSVIQYYKIEQSLRGSSNIYKEEEF
jgi:tetratricopeptide (TPR) repeat protein